MSANELAPVLTAEQWANVAVTTFSDSDRIIVNMPERASALIAIANAALPDDSPFKITREIIEDLREVAGAAEGEGWKPEHDEQDLRVKKFLDALAALLPPVVAKSAD